MTDTIHTRQLLTEQEPAKIRRVVSDVSHTGGSFPALVIEYVSLAGVLLHPGEAESHTAHFRATAGAVQGRESVESNIGLNLYEASATLAGPLEQKHLDFHVGQVTVVDAAPTYGTLTPDVHTALEPLFEPSSGTALCDLNTAATLAEWIGEFERTSEKPAPHLDPPHRFAQLVSRLRPVRTVLVTAADSGQRIWTVLDGEPGNRAVRDRVYDMESKILSEYPNAKIEFRLVNLTEYSDPSALHLPDREVVYSRDPS